MRAFLSFFFYQQEIIFKHYYLTGASLKYFIQQNVLKKFS